MENPNATTSSSSELGSPQHFFEHKKKVAQVKHQILSRYLGSWLGILSHNKFRSYSGGYSKLVYVDGFAGPGIYDDKKDGSPAVAYRLALTHTNLPKDGPPIFLIFIEKKPATCKLLLENLQQIKKENSEARNATKVKFMVIQGEFVNAMKWVLSKQFEFPTESMEYCFGTPAEFQFSSGYCGEFITATTPLLVFADPFGYSGKIIPMEIMRDIMVSSSRSEILLNLMIGSIRRFFKLDSRTQAINLLVGLDQSDAYWKPIVLAQKDTFDGISAFLKIYHDKLTELSRKNTYTSLFWMRDERNILIYNLYSVSQHDKAFVEMKRAMQSASHSEMVFRYSAFDAKNPDIEVEKVAIEDVVEMLKQQFQGQTVFGKAMTDFINKDTQNLYQKYKWDLKKELESFCVSENKSRKQPFDEMMYQFPVLENQIV